MVGTAIEPTNNLATQLLDAVHEGVFAVDKDGACQIWNAHMAKMTGIHGRAVLGHRALAAVPVLGHVAVREGLAASLRGETVEPLLFCWEHAASGQERWATAKFTTLWGGPGEITGVMATVSDTTGERLAAAEREALANKVHAAQKLESIGSLAGGVAHDLNNVLGAVLGLATAHRERLRGSTDEALLQSLDTIAHACLRGRSVVKSLLYVANKGIGDAQPVDLNELTQSLMELLRHATFSRVDVVVDLDPDLGLVPGDATGLSHALMNICANAVDAMPDGGTLSVRTRQAGPDRVELTVTDNGTGMAPEVVARATEPFYTTKQAGNGAGLGLAMTLGTVKAHSGEMAISSQLGRGTEVRLELPSLPRQPKAAQLAQADAAGGGESLDVLVVDDEAIIVLTMTVMLERMGHRPRSTMRGEDAIAMLDSGYQPDLVTLDMVMPGMDGAATLVEILKRRPGQRVLIASGHSEEDVRKMVGSAPNLDSIQKPFTMRELQARITALAGARLSQAS